MKLSVKRIQSLREPGRYADGAGLYLVITKSKSKNWLHRVTVNGRRRDLGLGRFPDVSLSQARQRCAENRALITDGIDPKEREAATERERKAPTIPTFREAAISVHAALRPRWRSKKHARQWLQAVEKHCFPTLGSVPVDQITRRDVIQCLRPIWTRTPEQGRRVLQKMRAIFRWCVGNEYIENTPCGDALDFALIPQPAIKQHFRALHYSDVPPALETVKRSNASDATRLSFRFMVLTATRNAEARAATWEEIDLDRRVWEISGDKMKAGRPHRIPLSGQAVEVLREARGLNDGQGLIFPSPRKRGGMLSDMALLKVLRDAGLADKTTAHGFRSAFKTWAVEMTSASWEASEAALAHQVGNTTERAYARTDWYTERRPLMQAWADYVAPCR